MPMSDDREKLANEFNEYFVSVADKLAEKFDTDFISIL